MTPPPIVAPPTEPVQWSLLAARGDDARTFLQGQLSCDVLSLSAGQSSEGLLLTPGGEVITSVACHFHPEGVDLVVRAELAAATTSALRRFLMRTKCDFLDGGASKGAYATVGEQVERGEPGPNEFALGIAAHSFGQLFVERHVSFTKGCYTGQELIGRLDARGGHVPFHLARVTGDDLETMVSVVAGAGPTGNRALQGLTTVVGDTGFSALALVHRTLLGDESSALIEGVRIELLHGDSRSAR